MLTFLTCHFLKFLLVLVDNGSYEIIHQIFSLARYWSRRVTWANIPQFQLGNIRGKFPNFQNCARCEKDLKDNKHNSLHLGQKYARIFVLGHYLFLVAHSFPPATFSENCSLFGTDNVCGQISQHIFAPNGGYCLYIFVSFPKFRLLNEFQHEVASFWIRYPEWYVELMFYDSLKSTSLIVACNVH